MKRISEIERLAKRLADQNCTGFHVDPEPGVPAEDVARELNRAFARIDAGLLKPTPAPDTNVPQIDVRDWLK